MKYLFWGFLIALLFTMIMSPGTFAPVRMPVGIGDNRPSAMGTKRMEGGIPEIDVVDSNGLARYAIKVSDKHGNRNVQFPHND